MTTTKSPRRVAEVALAAAREVFGDYSHRFSPKKFTRPQLFACLALKEFEKKDYRGVCHLLADCSDLRAAIGLKSAPHYTTLHKAGGRLLKLAHVRKLLDAAVRLVERIKPRRGRNARKARKSIGYGAADSSGFDARHASRYFIFRTTANSADNHRLLREVHGILSTIPAEAGRPPKDPRALPADKYRRLMKTRFNTRAYRKRPQVETVFSMLKRNLGAALRGRSHWARCRDLLLRVLTHNIMLNK